MKKVITTALAAALLASTAGQALAQERTGRAGQQFRDHPQGSPERAERQAGAQERHAAPPPPAPEPRRAGRAGVIVRDQPPPAPQARPAPQAPPAPRPPEAHRGGGGHDWNRRPDDRRWNDDRWNDDRRHDDNRRWDDHRWNDGRRPGERDRPRYDRRYYPPVYRIPHRYRVAPYRPPPGWYAFSWSFGDVLPHTWYGPQYRILDWWSYGLPIPPAGYDWVRVGDDALLVDSFNGRVVQVVYDLFW
ncbi:MAG: RcnB family protein [Phenylobacterium sp.]|uniref:RcnB family protein n=1 Tax=Phenylobacterium sp. TaxID=1871053 RepID=UPI00391CC5E4